ncbi:MAG: hypothetical protein H8E78_06610 [Proteobacteria bacterium]|nr:hypothetical protein [Pseudomonadota bacterium]
MPAYLKFFDLEQSPFEGKPSAPIAPRSAQRVPFTPEDPDFTVDLVGDDPGDDDSDGPLDPDDFVDMRPDLFVEP